MNFSPFHAGRDACEAMGTMLLRPVITEDSQVMLLSRCSDTTCPSGGWKVPARYQPRGRDGRFLPYAVFALLLREDIADTYAWADWDDARRTGTP